MPKFANWHFTLKDLQDLSRMEQQLRPFVARLRTMMKVTAHTASCH